MGYYSSSRSSSSNVGIKMLVLPSGFAMAKTVSLLKKFNPRRKKKEAAAAKLGGEDQTKEPLISAIDTRQRRSDEKDALRRKRREEKEERKMLDGEDTCHSNVLHQWIVDTGLPGELGRETRSLGRRRNGLAGESIERDIYLLRHWVLIRNLDEVGWLI